MSGVAGRSGPPGNTNGRKARLFEQAFIRAIKARDLSAGDGETLRRIADKLLDLALSGDVQAFNASRDTVDGKPTQAMEHSGADGAPLRLVIEK